MENFVQYWQLVIECTAPMNGLVGPSIAALQFFIFEASNVPWELETEKTGAVGYTEHTFTSHVEKYSA
jgi:hypothetical protein